MAPLPFKEIHFPQQFCHTVFMFIKLTEKRNGKTSVRIVESLRKDKKIQQKTIMSLGCAEKEDDLEILKETARKMLVKLSNERKPTLPGMEEIVYGKETNKTSKNPKKDKIDLSYAREKERVIHGIGGVCGDVYDKMGFDTIIRDTYKDLEWNDILKTCVLSRVADPQSKRKTVDTLGHDSNQQVPLEKMYRMMDRLYRSIDKVKSLVAGNTLSLFNQEVDILFFDVTTLYFESFIPDDLRNYGFSKDCKFKETQVVLALITNSEGHPLSYELFPGNTSESTTLISVVERLKEDFFVRKAVLVADRAMFSDKNLQFMEEKGIDYVVAAKLRSMKKKQKEEILDTKKRWIEKFTQSTEGSSQEIEEYEYNNRRLVVSYCPKRANKDGSDRQRLINRLMKKIKKGHIPIKSLIPNYGTKKYIVVEKNTTAKLNEAKIEQETLWDGLHGIITNIKDQSAEELLTRYRGLWKIEEAFRVNKHNLKMRPIYHWKKRRIEAHIAICFLAYSLSYTMKYQLEQAGVKFSIQKMREVLKRDQYSIIEDQNSKKLYRFPSKFSEPIQAIYQAFGLKRVSEITRLP